MVTINLINKYTSYDDEFVEIDVNNIKVVFKNKMLTGVSKGRLTSCEEKAAIWFVNCDLDITSSVISS